MHCSTQLDTNHYAPLTIASPPTIATFCYLAHTVNISTTHEIFTHPRPETSQYLTVYTTVARICPCPPQLTTRPHHPILCQLCTLLARSIPPKIQPKHINSTHCPTCNTISHTSHAHILCNSCDAFTLLAQNLSANCWDTILYQPTPIHTIYFRLPLHTPF